ncbi:MAG: sulfur carrier protein ThiS [Promethearchaeota archaeon]
MIRVNNRDFSYDGDEVLTVALLFEIKRFTFPDIVVKINGVYIPPEDYADTPIHDGDDVMALHIFGGG